MPKAPGLKIDSVKPFRRRADAEARAKTLQPQARRMGYRVIVLPTTRRYGRWEYDEPPYSLYLVPSA